MSEAVSSTRSFKVGPGVAMHLIYSQAGTLGKAILEYVMNAVDAKATRVDVRIGHEAIKIVDDGMGFDGFAAVKELFEVLCFDHGPADQDHRVFGRFGLGRAQMFAFASTVWRTQSMRMSVDVKNKGLDYDFEDGLEPVKGCTIDCQLYEPLKYSEALTVTKELTELALYCPIPVYINGELVSRDADDEKWDHETEDAYIRLSRHGDMAVYNQGVLVRHYPAYQFGQGGVVVSKKNLEVNVARNDILLARCEVWKRIAPFLRAEIAKQTRRRKTLNDDERQRLIRDWVDGELEWDDVKNLQLFKMATGRSVLARTAFLHNSTITLGDPDSPVINDTIHRRGLARVLHPQMYEWFGFVHQGDPQHIKEERLWKTLCEMVPITRRTRFVPIGKLADMVDVGFEVFDKKDLKKRDVAILDALASLSYSIASHAMDMECAVGADSDGRPVYATGIARSRQVHLGRSDAALGWTDGVSNITIDRAHARQVGKGMAGIGAVLHTMIHEYCHDAPTAGEHDHDQDFYERFHDLSEYQGAFMQLFISKLLTNFKRAGININMQLMRAGDLLQESGAVSAGRWLA